MDLPFRLVLGAGALTQIILSLKKIERKEIFIVSLSAIMIIVGASSNFLFLPSVILFLTVCYWFLKPLLLPNIGINDILTTHALYWYLFWYYARFNSYSKAFAVLMLVITIFFTMVFFTKLSKIRFLMTLSYGWFLFLSILIVILQVGNNSIILALIKNSLFQSSAEVYLYFFTLGMVILKVLTYFSMISEMVYTFYPFSLVIRFIFNLQSPLDQAATKISLIPIDGKIFASIFAIQCMIVIVSIFTNFLSIDLAINILIIMPQLITQLLKPSILLSSVTQSHQEKIKSES